MEVTVSLSDGKGMSSTIKGSLMVDNLLSLTSTLELTKRAGQLHLGWAAFIHPDHPGFIIPRWVGFTLDRTTPTVFGFGIRIQSLVVDQA